MYSFGDEDSSPKVVKETPFSLNEYAGLDVNANHYYDTSLSEEEMYEVPIQTRVFLHQIKSCIYFLQIFVYRFNNKCKNKY